MMSTISSLQANYAAAAAAAEVAGGGGGDAGTNCRRRRCDTRLAIVNARPTTTTTPS